MRGFSHSWIGTLHTSSHQPLPRWIGAIWIVATCVALVRLAVAWRRSQEAYSHTAIPAPRSLVEIANSVARHLGLRSAPAVRECDSIDSPAVLGAWGAMVVFPMRGLEHLSESQLRGIVAHELMHVRRRDGMTNLVQCVLDAVVWFHPAARDISGNIRIEREKICDSFGARVCGDAREYVHGLVQLEESRAPDAQLVLAARHGALLDRAQHLLVPRRARGSAPGYVAALVIGLTVGLSAALAWPSAALAGAVRTAPREFTVQGRDRAGEFSLTIRSGRAVAARINGAIVPAGSILQKHDSVYVLDLRGLTSLAVRVKPSGITSAARKPTH